MRISLTLWLLTAAASSADAFTITPTTTTTTTTTTTRSLTTRTTTGSRLYSSADASSDTTTTPTTPTTPPPVLNGKMVLPLKVVKKGLDGHKVAGVYALLSSDFKRGSDGWENVLQVGTTMDLAASLQDTQDAAHVRVLSFSFPQKDAMEDVAQLWRESMQAATGSVSGESGASDAAPVDTDDMLRRAQMNAMTAFDEHDDDDDDFDDEDDIEMMLPPPPSSSKTSSVASEEEVISPFSEGALAGENKDLPFTAESVNIVLEEVRPYLIADGGNVSVDRVDPETKNVYLKLEGACGTCPSSTVTMQMGIERVLKENFSDLGQVIQVDSGVELPSELTMDMVMLEINRMYVLLLFIVVPSKPIKKRVCLCCVCDVMGP